MTSDHPSPPTVLHVGHHPQPGGGFGDLLLRVGARPDSSRSVVGLIDSAPDCIKRARARLAGPVKSVTAFGSGPVSIVDILAALPRAAGVRALRRLINRYNADIVHANEFRAGLIGSIAALLSGRPFVQHVHHTASHRRHPWLRRWLFRAADRVVHVSEHTRLTLADGEPGHVVIRSPIDVDAFRARSADPDALAEASGIGSRPTVALIGRIAPNKGHETFIRAATGVDANFLVVGSGDEEIRRSLESLTDDLGVEDRVSFVGYWENVVDAYALSDVVVVPSRDENLPKVIQEALAREVPVVASRDGGIPELIEDGETGLLIDPDDDGQELAAALERLLDDEQLRATLAAAGLERLRSEFDAPVVAARLEELYSEVLVDGSTG